MSIKRYRIFLSSIIFAVIIACLAAVIFYYSGENGGQENEFSQGSQGYLLQEHEERIGVYRLGEEAPFRVLDVYVATLPYQDKQSLKEGITVSGEDELRRLIEDFDS